MQNISKPSVFNLLLKILILPLFMGITTLAYGQDTPRPADTVKRDTIKLQKRADNLSSQYDVGDLFKAVFHPGKKTDSLKKRSGITIIPNVASNPTIGSQIGIKAVAGRVLGNEPGTYMSAAATSASITTKGILYFYINHNVYTPGNRWNFQGSLVAAKSVTPDFGLGIGRGSDASPADHALTDPERKGYVFNSLYYNFREKVYKEVKKNLFLGAGVSFDIRRKIENRRTNAELTPYNIYSDRYGFDRNKYMSNGLLFNIQYTTRDNQNRAYKGIYVDAGIRANQTWMGSDKNALLFTTDFRKYWSLSSSHPEHVIAFWNWGAYVLNGALPYLELPGTGKDGSFRSGRGYVGGYFKSPQYDYSEIEYRFPITANKFLSGVAFFNIQTASDNGLGTKLFEQWQPGGGAGLRVLFNKHTRTNLCLDYAWGNYGARGFFLGLNEAF